MKGFAAAISILSLQYTSGFTPTTYHGSILSNSYINNKKRSYHQIGPLPCETLTHTITAFSNNMNNLSFKADHEEERLEYSINRCSSSDWLHNIKTIGESTVLSEIRNPVITVAIWSQIVAIAHRIMRKSTSACMNKIAENMCITHVSHSFLVSSIGLLLVFRTNSAYQRFTEGRRIWEQILSVSRNLSRMISVYDRDVGKARSARLKNLLSAFPFLLRHHIRPDCLGSEAVKNLGNNALKLEKFDDAIDTRYEGDSETKKSIFYTENGRKFCHVDRRDLPWCLLPKEAVSVKNRPLWVLDRISKEIVDIPYSDNFTSRERLTLLGMVNKLSNKIGECERIHLTAVPLNYARHSLRSLTIWLLTLPFVMVKDAGLLSGPIAAVISWVLFGVYQIGYTIEDPFQRTLRLSILCKNIHEDIIDADGERDSAYFVRQGEELDSSYEEELSSMNNKPEEEFVLRSQYDQILMPAP